MLFLANLSWSQLLLLRLGEDCSVQQWFAYFGLKEKHGYLFSQTTVEIEIHLSSSILVDLQVVFQGKQAVGVTYRKAGRQYTVLASKEVVVSAGVVNSPKLLMLSGVGPREHLEELGVSLFHSCGRLFEVDMSTSRYAFPRGLSTAEHVRVRRF